MVYKPTSYLLLCLVMAASRVALEAVLEICRMVAALIIALVARRVAIWAVLMVRRRE